MARYSCALALVAIVLAVAVVGGDRARAQSEGNGLEETSVNTFLFDASRGVLRVEVDITLTNVTRDQRDGNIIRQRYFDSYYVAVPVGAENIVVTRNGQTLEGELTSDPEFPAFSFYEFPLGFRLFSGNTTNINVTYDHLGAGPRNEVPWRVNAAYASFVAFGLGDDEQVTIRIVRPVGFEFDEFTDLSEYEASEPDGFGSITYTREGGDETFETVVGMSNDDFLAERELDVAGVDIDLRSWPDDPEWADFAAERVEQGIPVLEELIGSEWPVEGDFDVRQTVEPNLYGYAGWFDEASSEIAVGEELDADLIYHELSHAWFNNSLVRERWMSEGLAQVYAAEMVERDGEEPFVATEPSSGDPGYRTLHRWETFEQAPAVEEFGYNASHWVMDELVGEIGFDATRDVLTALADETSPFDPEARAVDRIADWQRFYDLLVEVGGSTLAPEIFEAHVIDLVDAPLLAERDAVVSDLEALRDRSAPYELPEGVRGLVERWDFDDAESAMTDAGDVLDLRDELDALRDTTSIDEPDASADAYASASRSGDGSVDFTEATEPMDASIERGEIVVARIVTIDELADSTSTSPPPLADTPGVDDFATAIEASDDRIDALEQLRDAIDQQRDTTGFAASIGLWGTDVDADLDAARAAIANGDDDAARDATSRARTTLDAATDDGEQRITSAAIGVGVILLALVLLAVLRRRRRRSAEPEEVASGGGLLGVAGEDLGGGRVDLDEDALAGAHLGGVDDGTDVAVGDASEAARAAGVVAGPAGLGDVGDAVLELDEDVVAVVDTDPVSGTEVLVDPHAHDSE